MAFFCVNGFEQIHYFNDFKLSKCIFIKTNIIFEVNKTLNSNLF
jgi:hypothetical protein